jgi:hypothetical protein
VALVTEMGASKSVVVVLVLVGAAEKGQYLLLGQGHPESVG